MLALFSAPPTPSMSLWHLLEAGSRLILSWADVITWFLMLGLALTVPLLRKLVFESCPKSSPVTPISGPRSVQIDAIRAVAITAVMGIHTLYFPAAIPGLALPDWVSAALLNNMMRFAVPVFLILSGYCLMPWSSLSLPSARANFYLKKIKRVFLPYTIIASILYVSEHSFSWEGLAHAVLCGTTSPPFYFIIVLGQLYLLYPLLCSLSRFPLALLSVSLLISALSYLHQPWQNFGDFPLFTAYLFPFVFGMVSRNLKLEPSPSSDSVRAWYAPVAILAIATYLVSNVIFSFAVVLGGQSSSALGLYSFNFQFFYAIPILFVFFELFNRTPALARAIAPLGKYSLWIFLLHYPVQEVWWGLISPSTSLPALITSLLSWAALTLFFWLATRRLECRHLHLHPRPN